MTKSASRSVRSLIALGALLMLVPGIPVGAAAAPTKTWVAFYGADSPSCGAATAPCATFQQAHDNVAAGGEVGVLTPGDYGLVQITKPASITDDGTGQAGIQAPGGNWAVNIGVGSGAAVSVRGLVIDGVVSGAVGIRMVGSQTVHIQNCVIKNFEGIAAYGIIFDAFGAVPTQVFVSDTIIFNNGSTADSGGILVINGASAGGNVVLDRVHLENNVIGLKVDGSANIGNGMHVVVRDSVVAGNAGDGIRAVSVPGAAPAFVLVERTSAVNNGGIGIHADGPRATILLKDNTITRNGTGIGATNGGQLISYGNNTNNNNIGPEGAPTGFFSPM